MFKIIPLILILFGSGAGIFAGMMMRPVVTKTDAPSSVDVSESIKAVEGPSDKGLEGSSPDREYVKLSNQFVIPVVEDGSVASLVVMSLSVEVKPGYRDGIFAREPKLRDSFLQVLFDHANVGGFRGAFTDANNLDVLRVGLREVAMRDAGDQVTDVLILEIARQDYQN